MGWPPGPARHTEHHPSPEGPSAALRDRLLAELGDWEQNRRQPDGAARVLLMVIDKEPDAVTRALAAA